MGRTHPSGFALILECFFGVLRGRLNVVHGVLHVVLNAINHLALYFLTFFNFNTVAQRFPSQNPKRQERQFVSGFKR